MGCECVGGMFRFGAGWGGGNTPVGSELASLFPTWAPICEKKKGAEKRRLGTTRTLAGNKEQQQQQPAGHRRWGGDGGAPPVPRPRPTLRRPSGVAASRYRRNARPFSLQAVWASLLLLLLQQHREHPAGRRRRRRSRQQGALLPALLRPAQCGGGAPPAGAGRQRTRRPLRRPATAGRPGGSR